MPTLPDIGACEARKTVICMNKDNSDCNAGWDVPESTEIFQVYANVLKL